MASFVIIHLFYLFIMLRIPMWNIRLYRDEIKCVAVCTSQCLVCSAFGLCLGFLLLEVFVVVAR